MVIRKPVTFSWNLSEIQGLLSIDDIFPSNVFICIYNMKKLIIHLNTCKTAQIKNFLLSTALELTRNRKCFLFRIFLCANLDTYPQVSQVQDRVNFHKKVGGAQRGQMTRTSQRDIPYRMTSCLAYNWGSWPGKGGITARDYAEHWVPSGEKLHSESLALYMLLLLLLLLLFLSLCCAVKLSLCPPRRFYMV